MQHRTDKCLLLVKVLNCIAQNRNIERYLIKKTFVAGVAL